LVEDLVALVATGRPSTPAAEAMFLAVTRTAPSRADVDRWSQLLDRVTRVRCRLDAVASDAIGWLPASSAVVDVFARATCVWGDRSVIDVVPARLPREIPADEAFSMIDGAHAALDAGDAVLARRLAVGALLVSRGAYDPDPTTQGRSLAAVWPEAAEAIRPMPATVAVAHAHTEAHRWRFAWEGEGPGEAAVMRWRNLRSAWQPQHDGVVRAGNDGDA
jgi:hypothetical protein